MTAATLIKKLQQLPPETRVVVAGYEDGFNDIEMLKQLHLKLNAKSEWYYGQHEKSDTENGVVAIALLGKNKLTQEG